jgi:hypothetical protein
VSVTVVLSIDSSIDVLSQVDAVLAQTVHPEHLWLVVDSDVHLPRAISRQSIPDYIGFQVFVQEHIGERNWLSIANLATTKYTWIMTNGVQPGVRYLDRLLRLSQTDEYRHALIGTEGAILPFSPNMTLSDADDMVCLPQAIEAGDLPNVSVAVDMLTDTWLLRQEWIPIIMAHTTPDLFRVPNGFRISLTLNRAGIITIALPINPIDQAYWGDTREHTRTMHEQGSLSCRQRKEEYMFNQEWYHVLSRNQHALVSEVHELTDASNSIVDIAFLVTNLEEVNAITPLICAFVQRRRNVHLINAGDQDFSQMYSASLLSKQSNCDIENVHDVNLSSMKSNGWSDEEGIIVETLRIPAVHTLLQLLQPRLIIHSFGSTVWNDMPNLDIDIPSTFIQLPPQDLAHITWMATLPIDTLESKWCLHVLWITLKSCCILTLVIEWNLIDINLILITNTRPDAFSRLMRSLDLAHFLGDTVKLTVNMEQTVDKITKVLVNNFVWKYGEKVVRHRIRQAGVMAAVVESWYPSNANEYAIFLEDTVEVSPYFYIWAKFAILKYRYADFQDESKMMFGISLYSPPSTELHMEGRKPFTPDEMVDLTLASPKSPYLLQIPCNWGAVYFPEHWQEFHDYITARLLDQSGKNLQDIQVPGSQSNYWEQSWRRYFIELIYLRGYVMLYPNFENYTSFSTNHLEYNSLPGTDQDALEETQVPMMTIDTIMDELSNAELPDWRYLPVFDAFGTPSFMQRLQEKGRILHLNVSACDPAFPGTTRFDPSDLLCPFPKHVIEEELKPTPAEEDGNVHYATVYVVVPESTTAPEETDEDHWKADNLTGNTLVNHYDEQAFDELVAIVKDQLEAEGPNVEIEDERDSEVITDQSNHWESEDEPTSEEELVVERDDSRDLL